MNTRSGRAAQAAAKGRSAPSAGTQVTTRVQKRVPKGRGAASVANATSGRGRGAAEVATVGSVAGTSEVNPTTAQPNQIVLYEEEDDVLGAPQTPVLSGHGPQTTYRVTLDRPSYDPTKNDLWERYTQ